jgi:hypothetical protein
VPPTTQAKFEASAEEALKEAEAEAASSVLSLTGSPTRANGKVKKRNWAVGERGALTSAAGRRPDSSGVGAGSAAGSPPPARGTTANSLLSQGGGSVGGGGGGGGAPVPRRRSPQRQAPLSASTTSTLDADWLTSGGSAGSADGSVGRPRTMQGLWGERVTVTPSQMSALDDADAPPPVPATASVSGAGAGAGMGFLSPSTEPPWSAGGPGYASGGSAGSAGSDGSGGGGGGAMSPAPTGAPPPRRQVRARGRNLDAGKRGSMQAAARVLHPGSTSASPPRAPPAAFALALRGPTAGGGGSTADSAGTAGSGSGSGSVNGSAAAGPPSVASSTRPISVHGLWGAPVARFDLLTLDSQRQSSPASTASPAGLLRSVSAGSGGDGGVAAGEVASPPWVGFPSLARQRLSQSGLLESTQEPAGLASQRQSPAPGRGGHSSAGGSAGGGGSARGGGDGKGSKRTSAAHGLPALPKPRASMAGAAGRGGAGGGGGGKKAVRVGLELPDGDDSSTGSSGTASDSDGIDSGDGRPLTQGRAPASSAGRPRRGGAAALGGGSSSSGAGRPGAGLASVDTTRQSTEMGSQFALIEHLGEESGGFLSPQEAKAARRAAVAPLNVTERLRQERGKGPPRSQMGPGRAEAACIGLVS